MTSRTVTVILPAAGKGSRAGFEKNKLLQALPHLGVTPIERAAQAFCLPCVTQIIVACSKEDEAEMTALLAPYDVTFVRGGATRTESVKNALAAANGEIVLIHDGARPFVSEACIYSCIESVEKYGSGVCAVPVTDTIAKAQNGVVETVPDRNVLFSLQTPQGFFLQDIKTAYAKIQPRQTFTDDSSVYAEFIKAPRLCAGDPKNIKLTFSSDFEGKACRAGIGIDTHAFGKEQDFIVMAGVKVPSDSGLIAHSDGDVLVHAVMDALLSAAGLRDIGFYFPDTDEKWKNADSMKMLEQVMQEVRKQNFTPCNLSVAIQAQKPRLAKYIPLMVENLATALALPVQAVGVTAGTNEGLGYVGEGKGITVTANVLLQPLSL